MKALYPRNPEQIALTQYLGIPEFLDGNRLFFVATGCLKGREPDFTYGVVDLSKGRDYSSRVPKSSYPVKPIRSIAHCDVKTSLFGDWLVNIGNRCNPYDESILVQRPGGIYPGTINELTVESFYHACQKPELAESMGVTSEWIRTITEKAERRRAERQLKLDAKFKPMPEYNEELTQAIVRIFTFHGNKKELVTALKTSFGVELRDSDVKVDTTFGTRIIFDGSNLEALIG
jgi:hypothetical protein